MNEKKHFKIIGIVAVLMLLCVACVGAASADDGYKITFAGGGASGQMDPVTLPSGVTTYTLPENSFIWEGYHFDCWQVSGTSPYTSSPGAVITATEDLTVTAEMK